MSDNQPLGAADGRGQWQPGFHDAQGLWHGGFYDPDGQWQPGFYDAEGAWQAGFHDAEGGWHPGYRTPDGTWNPLDEPAHPQTVGSDGDRPAAASAQPASASPQGEASDAGRSRGMWAVLIVLGVFTVAMLGTAAWLLLSRPGGDPAADQPPAAQEAEQEELDEGEASPETTAEPGLFIQAPAQEDFERGRDLTLPPLPAPVGTVTIDDFAEVDSVQTDGQTAVAAEGEQLRYVEWSYEPADDPWSEDGELSVRIGGEEQSGALAGEEISGSFIASVAEGDALVLSAHGVEQEISLAEGEATDPEAAALFHLPEIPHTLEVGETFVFPDQTLYSGDEGSEHNAQLIINRAMLTYEHDELEWDPEAYQDGYNWENQDAWMLYGLDSTGPAEPGSIWLILDMRIEIQGPDGVLDFDGGTWTLTAVDQDGGSTQHEYTSEASGIDQWPYGDYGAAFEIPISAATVDLVASLEVEYEGQSSTIESAIPITLDLLPEN